MRRSRKGKEQYQTQKKSASPVRSGLNKSAARIRFINSFAKKWTSAATLKAKRQTHLELSFCGTFHQQTTRRCGLHAFKMVRSTILRPVDFSEATIQGRRRWNNDNEAHNE